MKKFVLNMVMYIKLKTKTNHARVSVAISVCSLFSKSVVLLGLKIQDKDGNNNEQTIAHNNQKENSEGIHKRYFSAEPFNSVWCKQRFNI